jgi:uncharacterized membrane protein (DUF4010 family)
LDQPLFLHSWLPLTISAVVGLAYSAFLYFKQRRDEKGDIQLSNPMNLGSAVRFGLLFTGVLLVSRVTEFYFGDVGLMLSSVVSGLTNATAVTLSVTELSRRAAIGLDVATQALLLAIIANLISKGGIVIFGGDRELRRVIFPGLVLMLATAVLLMLIF